MLHERYLEMLSPFAAASKPWVTELGHSPELATYGPGYDGWGVQTNQKAFSGLAVLASDPAYDEKTTGVSRDELTARSLALLRFSLASHKSGPSRCTDGKRWGHTWISALGVERMMHAVEAIDGHLTDADRVALRGMLISESDWLLDCYPVEAGPVENNKPESNIWNGAIMHRTAMMYPDAPRAAAYRDKGTRFLLNGISVPEDAESETPIAGRPISEWHVGHNFFESYALNHHRYLNVGYMVICLSNLAMLHFSYRARGLEAPEALYHHAEDLYRLIEMCTFPDGRLWRVGGDTRARYCYCQDYAIPMWLMMRDHYGDRRAASLESGWLAQVAREVEHNGDGAYLSDRCATMRGASPLYYTRLESDRASALSMGAYWTRVVEGLDGKEAAPVAGPTGNWHDPYHGACMARGKRRAASFVWDSGEKPTGLCVPLDRSDMAEWRESLAGCVRGEGLIESREIVFHEERSFKGGFLTWGATRSMSRGMVAEGQSDEETAMVRIAFAALPDDATCLVVQQAQTPDRRLYLTEVLPLHLPLPNDLFNGGARTYRTAEGEFTLEGEGRRASSVDTGSTWLVADERLAVALAWGGESLHIRQPGRRQIELRPAPNAGKNRAGGSLACDEILAGAPREGMVPIGAGETLFDVGAAVRVMGEDAGDGAPITCRMVEGPDGVSQLGVTGADGREYLLMVNMGDEPVAVDVFCPKWVDVVSGEACEATVLELGAGGARLLVCE